jgi:hypothetical protein
MGWSDFILERSVTNEDLAEAIARVVGLSAQAVSITSEVPERDPGNDFEVWGTTTALAGDFKTAVALYPQSEAVVRRVSGRRLIEELSLALGCRSLMPDDTPNLYRMMLIEGPGAGRCVLLDPEKLDQEEPEYSIKREDTA